MPEHNRRSTDRLENRLEFDTLISELSSRFINLLPDEVDQAIELALRRVCEPLEIDLAVLWQWSATAPELIAPTHVYYAGEGPRPSEPMRQEQYPWSREQVLAGRTIVVSSLDDLPVEASVDRETCRLFGIKAVLCLPLGVGSGQPIGALGFNCLRAERHWPDALVNRLRLVAQVFTNALARRRGEEAYRRSEARLAAGADLAGLAYYEVNFGESVAYTDDRFRSLCGLPRERQEGLQALEFWMERLHPDDRQRVLDAREQLHSGEVDPLTIEYRFLHPTQGTRWLHHVGRAMRRDPEGRAVVTFGVIRDVTEARATEEALRDLSRKLIGAHEEERALLARELHDDVTQRLAVLAIEVGRAELGVTDGPQTEAMRVVRDGLVRLSEDIHTLAYQLHPSVLEELGLDEALRTECERLGRRSAVALTADLDRAPSGVGKDAALCLFRVAQESLNNMTRHSFARSASVTLRQMDGGLLLAVRDDGVGFDPEASGKGRSLGLASMRERVRLVNGTLDIESAPGHGTAVVAWVPGEGVS